jgi:hypothetical protein
VHLLLLLLAITACSTSERSSSSPPAQELDKAPPAAAAQAAQAVPMGTSDAASDVAPSAAADRDAAALPECAQSALKRSRCMIDAVLRDLKTSYPLTGGGGISDLSLVATDTYAVSIAQEERIDVITYTLALDDRGQVLIQKRSESTKSPRR